MFKRILTPLASLKLTVVLLAMAMVLIYAGTWAQVDTGIWQVQARYFHSYWCWISFQTLLPRPGPGQHAVPGGFPMLGGFTVGTLLLVNLLAAHTVRFKFNRKRIGIIMIHFGIVLLLIGEGISAGMRNEAMMTIDTGGSSNWTYDSREVELAVVDPTPADHDDVAVIHGDALKAGETIHSPKLPFDVRIDAYYPNANIMGPKQVEMAGLKPDSRATAGAGTEVTLVSLPPAGGTESAVDAPGAYVTPILDGKALGTYLLSPFYLDTQPVTVGGKTYGIALRYKREYKPYTIQLLKFTHARYTGTDMAKDFASNIRLIDKANNTDREVRIWMNHPLRYAPSGNYLSGGETIYQFSFTPSEQKGRPDRGTTLQVVKNPGWLLPYFAVAITGIGLVIHFTMTLVIFLRKQRTVSAQKSSGIPPPLPGRRGEYQLEPRSSWARWEVIVPAVFGAMCVVYIASLFVPAPKQTFDLDGFGKLPLSYEGRIQPFDSLARNALRGISNHETTTVDNVEIPAIVWLLDVIAKPEKAANYKVFRVDHPDLKSLLGDDESKYFSFKDYQNHKEKLAEQFRRMPEDEKKRDVFQRKLAEYGNKLELFTKLSDAGSLYILPPDKPDGEWQQLAKAKDGDPTLERLRAIAAAWADDKPADFNRAVATYQASISKTLPIVARHVSFEHFYNRFAPFMQCMVLYILTFVLVACSWLGARKVLWRSAFVVLVITFLVHTAGLVARIYISGRPPVTNLAASSLFIGWGICLLCIGLESLYKNGLGTALASALGFVTLLIAYQLSLDGDNMKVLVAVLDTNFWLATHVVAVTFGYATTFLAGFLGIVYVGMRLFAPNAAQGDAGKTVTKMTYGIVCFAMLFSFVGTILGGIWADQSWGRFWGWDPKENGAVLVVLANALLLHARWGGMAKARGIACLAILGNIVTSWSWFGTNMLGVGLHSYGFMDSALKALLVFVGSQLLLILLAFLPVRPTGGTPGGRERERPVAART